MKNKIFYNTDTQMSGPWFLDELALRELDHLLEEEFENLKSLKERDLHERIAYEIQNSMESIIYRDMSREDLAREIERRLRKSPPFDEGEKFVYITLKSGKKIRFPSFASAMANEELSHHKVIEVSAELRCGLIKCEVSLNEQLNFLRIRTAPNDRDETSELFIRLKNWAESFRLSTTARLWASATKTGVGFFLLFIIWAIGASMATAAPSDQMDTVRLKAVQLINEGITEENQAKALELMLSLQTKYAPSSPEGTTPLEQASWYFWFLILICGILVALFFPPRNAIGLGKGSQAIKRQKLWVKAVTIAIPAYVILNLFIPTVFNVLASNSVQ